MRWHMVKLFFCCFLTAAVAFCALPGPSQAVVQKDRRDIKFRWAFGVIRTSGNTSKVEPVTADTVLASGDKLQMMVELNKKCFVYVIYHSSQGEVTMLFPYNINQFEADYHVSKKYYVPKEGSWFQLDSQPGRETFYLIASDQRLIDVEYLYSRYMSAEPAKRPDLAGQVIAELRTIRDQYRATAAEESPEMLAKNDEQARGFERATGADPTDVATLAREVNFNSLYSDTFLIEHK